MKPFPRLATAVCAAASLLLTGAALAEPAKVKIDSGVLVGIGEGAVLAFKGVPYAAAPVGRLRWAPPQGPAPWPGERDADAFGAVCPQKINPEGAPNEGGVTGGASEDCLFLNLWSPRGARKAPVMVWLHGGGDAYGAGSVGAYDGSAFARDGVILVTLNYRLGALGFFAHPALTRAAPPDEPLYYYGALDQIAALEWVKRNIAAFGGDVANVTLAGESAGGADALMLMTTPAAQGLFQRVIVESGPGWRRPATLAAAEVLGQASAARAGASASATIEELRALPADALVRAYASGFDFVLDGRLATETPTQAFAANHFAHVPLIIGSNSFEASLMRTLKIPAAAVIALTPQAARAPYVDLTTEADKADAIFTDAFLGAPARWTAAKVIRGPTFLYRFSFVDSRQRSLLKGAPHAYEIPFVFDSWDHLGSLSMGVKPDAADLAVTRRVHGCWVAFAKTGAPACPDVPAWPAYTRSGDTLMDFDLTANPKTAFRKAQYDALETAILPTLAVAP